MYGWMYGNIIGDVWNDGYVCMYVCMVTSLAMGGLMGMYVLCKDGTICCVSCGWRAFIMYVCMHVW